MVFPGIPPRRRLWVSGVLICIGPIFLLQRGCLLSQAAARVSSFPGYSKGVFFLRLQRVYLLKNGTKKPISRIRCQIFGTHFPKPRFVFQFPFKKSFSRMSDLAPATYNHGFPLTLPLISLNPEHFSCICTHRSRPPANELEQKTRFRGSGAKELELISPNPDLCSNLPKA